MGNSERDLVKICTDANVMRGLSIRGAEVASCEKQVAEWAKANI